MAPYHFGYPYYRITYTSSHYYDDYAQYGAAEAVHTALAQRGYYWDPLME